MLVGVFSQGRRPLAPQSQWMWDQYSPSLPPAGVNERLLVRLMVRPWPAGTVITTGDQVAGVMGGVVSSPLTAVGSTPRTLQST